jgi:diguanylate cyclase (GGDEF)-like protein
VLACIGGEELVVLGQVGDAAEAGGLAERLRTAVAATRTAGGHRVTASVGVAVARPVDGADPHDALWRLVDHADAAMYHAKQQGRDRVAARLVPHPRPPHATEHAPLTAAAEAPDSSAGDPV